MLSFDLNLMTRAILSQSGSSLERIQGLITWYDPSDLSTLFQDTEMTVPVTEAGQSVAVVCDKSGNGRHLRQPTASARAVLQTDGTRSWLLFDGVDDSYATDSFAWGSDAAQIVFGLRKNSDSAIGCLMETSDNSNNYNGTLAVFAPNATFNVGIVEFRSKGRSQAAATIYDVATNIPIVLTAGGKISAGTADARINGSLLKSSLTNQGTGSFGTFPLFVGRRANANFPFSGRLFGMACFNRILGSSEIATVESWMAAKAGVTL